MAKLNLTAKTVDGLKPKSKRVYYFDTNLPGFCISVTPKGIKSYSVMYRFAGRLRRWTIGTTDQFSLKDARDKAQDAIRAAAKNEEDKAAQKSEERLAETFGELAGQYLERWAKKRKDSWAEDERIIDKYLNPRFKNIRATEVGRGDVRAMLEKIANGAPIMANRVFACVRKIYSWGIANDIVEHSPCEGLSAPAPEHRRDRVLNASEIKKLWKALDAENSLVANVLKLRLLTIQRGEELMSMAWADIDMQARWWTIPGPDAKNDLPHRVWLTDPVMRILEKIKADNAKRSKRAGGPSPWVFPGKRKGKHLVEPKRPKDDIREAAGVDDWQARDLRRTGASLMASLGVPRFIIGRVLNHKESGVTAVYDRHSYDPEKKDALEKLAKHLMVLVSDLREAKNTSS